MGTIQIFINLDFSVYGHLKHSKEFINISLRNICEHTPYDKKIDVASFVYTDLEFVGVCIYVCVFVYLFYFMLMILCLFLPYSYCSTIDYLLHFLTRQTVFETSHFPFLLLFNASCTPGLPLVFLCWDIPKFFLHLIILVQIRSVASSLGSSKWEGMEYDFMCTSNHNMCL